MIGPTINQIDVIQKRSRGTDPIVGATAPRDPAQLWKYFFHTYFFDKPDVLNGVLHDDIKYIVVFLWGGGGE